MASRLFRLLALALPVGIVGAACGGTTISPGDNDGSTVGHNDGGSPTTETGTSDTGTTTNPDSSTTTDAPVSVDAGGIPCGASTCSPETQECCAIEATGALSCTAKGACDGGVGVMCSGPKSCPVSGDVCCANIGGGTGGVSVSCTTSMDCHGYLICQSEADCPDMESCETAILGYKICRKMGMGGDGGFHTPDGGFHPPDGGFVPPDGATP
jgi:hypothetical protein